MNVLRISSIGLLIVAIITFYQGATLDNIWIAYLGTFIFLYATTTMILSYKVDKNICKRCKNRTSKYSKLCKDCGEMIDLEVRLKEYEVEQNEIN